MPGKHERKLTPPPSHECTCEIRPNDWPHDVNCPYQIWFDQQVEEMGKQEKPRHRADE